MKSLRHTEVRPGRRRGVLTFEWILLISLLVIGIIGGLSAVRNSLLVELHDLDECIQSLNTSGESEESGDGASGFAKTTAFWWETSLTD
jgi:hypothetical protein